VAEKIINDPILFLKNKAESATRDRYLDVARRLFRLDEEIVSGEHATIKDKGGPEKPAGKSEEPLWISKR
jgi:glutamyl-tRNA reductase